MGGIEMMLALADTTLMASSVALAASAAEIDPDVDVALKKLYDTVPGGKVLAARARGILVFASIVKGGFIVGAQYGPAGGKLRRDLTTGCEAPSIFPFYNSALAVHLENHLPSRL